LGRPEVLRPECHPLKTPVLATGKVLDPDGASARIPRPLEATLNAAVRVPTLRHRLPYELGHDPLSLKIATTVGAGHEEVWPVPHHRGKSSATFVLQQHLLFERAWLIGALRRRARRVHPGLWRNLIGRNDLTQPSDPAPYGHHLGGGGDRPEASADGSQRGLVHLLRGGRRAVGQEDDRVVGHEAISRGRLYAGIRRGPGENEGLNPLGTQD